jgi:uncharacterized protein
MESFVFKNTKKQKLVGVLHHGKGQEPRTCLIVCHGFAGTKIGGSRRFVEFARHAVKHNISVFRFDFAGSGDSEGDLVDLTIDSELDDLQAAINVLTTKSSLDPEKIGIVGHCLGAVTAIRASVRDSRIYKTVAWAPFINLSNTMARLIGEEAFSVLQEGDETDFIYNEQLFRCSPKILNYASDLNMFEEITRIRKPLLVIHGTEDATVPLQEIEKLIHFAEGTPGQKRLEVLEGAHHSFPYHQEELFELTVEWFL